jgi:putative SOS response-associated peptidase YedK
MCNLYSMTRAQDAMRRLFPVKHDRTGNLPSLPGIFPGYLAPVVRVDRDGERALEMMRWGFPPPKLGGRPIINVRIVKRPPRRGWLKPEFRCLVPATSFCAYTDTQPTMPCWFALGADRPLFAFAGIWRPWSGARGTSADRKALADETGSENREYRPSPSTAELLSLQPPMLVRLRPDSNR